MAYAAWSVIAGEQPTAAKWNILGTNDASFNDGTGIGTSAILPNNLKAAASALNTWSWDSYTPTWTNLTVGNGVVTSKYIQIGKTFIWSYAIVFGTTSSVSGTITVTTPVTMPTLSVSQAMGYAWLDNASVETYHGIVLWNSTTSLAFMSVNGVADSRLVPVAAAKPVAAWGTGDSIKFMAIGEVA